VTWFAHRTRNSPPGDPTRSRRSDPPSGTVYLGAPTGIGKSAIAFTTAVNYRPDILDPAWGHLSGAKPPMSVSEPEHTLAHPPFWYITLYKNLQSQAQEDFDKPEYGIRMRDMRGRPNFDCALPNWQFQSARDAPCMYDERYQGRGLGGVFKCEEREAGNCDYYNQRDRALKAPISITNTHYAFSLLSVDAIPQRPLAIFDEGHRLPQMLVDQVLSFEVTPARWKSWGIDYEMPISQNFLDWVGEEICACDHAESNHDWADPHGLDAYTTDVQTLSCNECACPDFSGKKWSGPLQDIRKAVGRKLGASRAAARKMPNGAERDYALRSAGRLEKDYASVMEIINSQHDGWVPSYDDYLNTVKFRPVSAAGFGERMLKSVSPKRLVVTATPGGVMGVEIDCLDMGIDPEKTGFVEITKSTFPRPNRIVRVETGHGYMTSKKLKRNGPRVFKRACQLIEQHCKVDGMRGLIIPYTKRIRREFVAYYEKYFKEKAPMITEGRSKTLVWDRKNNEAVDHFVNQPDEPLVLISTVGEGLDFYGDLCEFIIILKMPNKNIGDPWIERRKGRVVDGFNNGFHWYGLESVREFEQFCGRGNRTPDDICYIYVLDAYSVKLLKQHKSKFERHFLEAVTVNGTRFYDWLNGRRGGFGNRSTFSFSGSGGGPSAGSSATTISWGNK
jgi:hypothetical protein